MSDFIDEKLLEIHKRALRARHADVEERKELIFDPTEEVLNALLDNQALSEEELQLIAQRKDISPELLRRLSADVRVNASYQLKRTLILNPKMPASISLKFLS